MVLDLYISFCILVISLVLYLIFKRDSDVVLTLSIALATILLIFIILYNSTHHTIQLDNRVDVKSVGNYYVISFPEDANTIQIYSARDILLCNQEYDFVQSVNYFNMIEDNFMDVMLVCRKDGSRVRAKYKSDKSRLENNNHHN